MGDYTDREILRTLRELLEVELANMGYLAQLVGHNIKINKFHIRRTDMPLNPIVPGSTAVYTATPTPAGAVPTTPPSWTSSDPTDAPVTVDPTGLIATVVVPATAKPGSFTLSINYTNPDGTVANGAITDTINPGPPPPPLDVTGFTIVRTA